MKTCNHQVGYFHRYGHQETILQSKWVDELNWASRDSKSMHKAYRSIFNQAFEPKDYLDERRSLATWFKFCPDCGEKIYKPKL